MSSTEWIHERFSDLLGFSEDTSVEFVLMIGIKYLKEFCNIFIIAKKSKSVEDIFKSLTVYGFPSNHDTYAFSNELFEIYSPFFKGEQVFIKNYLAYFKWF